MNIQKAAAEMRQLIVQRFHDASLLERHLPDAARVHLLLMLDKLESGEVTGEQAHRWLGWVQCAVYVNGAATLEEMKQINKRS